MAQSPNLVISQIYPGGGCSVSSSFCTAPYFRDYIELLNRGTNPVNIDGYTLQERDIISGNWSVFVTLPSHVINPGQYYLVAGPHWGGGPGAGDVNADFYFTTLFDLPQDNMSIALVKNGLPITSCVRFDCEQEDSNVVDKVGYGGGPCQEGVGPSGLEVLFDTEGMFRKDSGCMDTESNNADFEIAPALPRNSSFPYHSCPPPTFPVLVADPAAINGLIITTPGSPSNVKSYLLTGHNLLRSPDIVIISAAGQIELSLDSINFSPFLGLNYFTDDLPATRIYVRLVANATITTGFIYHCGGLAANLLVPVNDVVVPVKLNNFRVKKQNETVQLYWTTEQEINSKEFIVERSLNGYKWDELTSVIAAGNSAQKINYYATDFNPAKGVNYYRLKQVDADNRFVYSEIRSLYFGKEGNIVVAPNPAKDKVTVYLPGNSTTVFINIYNHSGQLVKTISSAGEAISVNVNNFPKGIYTLKITGKNINEEKKLVVE